MKIVWTDDSMSQLSFPNMLWYLLYSFSIIKKFERLMSNSQKCRGTVAQHSLLTDSVVLFLEFCIILLKLYPDLSLHTLPKGEKN